MAINRAEIDCVHPRNDNYPLACSRFTSMNEAGKSQRQIGRKIQSSPISTLVQDGCQVLNNVSAYVWRCGDYFLKVTQRSEISFCHQPQCIEKRAITHAVRNNVNPFCLGFTNELDQKLFEVGIC